MCTVLLPPGVNTIAVNKYINININYNISGTITVTWSKVHAKDPHMSGVRDLCTWSSHPMNSPLDALVPYIADAIKRCLKIYLRCASTQISKKKVRMWNLKAERISGTYRSFTNNGSKYYDAIRYSFTATWLPPGGSGPYICTQKEKNRYIYKLN